MAYYKATIEVLLDAEDDSLARDALSESLRDLLRHYGANQSAWIDWRYAPTNPLPEPHDGSGFEYSA